MRKKSSLLLVVIMLLTVAVPVLAAVQPSPETLRALDRGVIYRTISMKNDAGQNLQIHVIDANLSDSRVQFKVATPKKGLGGYATVSAFSRANYAVAGLNGGFFSASKSKYLPTDTIILNGKILTKGMRNPAAIGITKDNKVFIDAFVPHIVVTGCKSFQQYRVEAVNHETGIGLIMYDAAYGTRTGRAKTSRELVVETNSQGRKIVTAVYQGNAPIPVNGMVLSFQGTTGNILKNIDVGDELGVETYMPDEYTNVRDLLACGPQLIKNGKILPADVNFLEAKLKLRHPRSAVGLTAGNHLLLVAVDGRKKGTSVGMTYTELANLMKKLGAVNAMSLDGGDSTALFAGDKIANRPSAGKERSVANALLVISQVPVMLNNERVYFKHPPVVQNGIVYLDSEELLSGFGWSAGWDAETGIFTATNGVDYLQCVPNQVTALYQNAPRTMSQTPILINSRMMIPASLLSEVMGYTVNYDQRTETLSIQKVGS